MTRSMIVVVLVVLLSIAGALECMKREKCSTECPTVSPTECGSGCTTKDFCDCCDVCARSEGEECEGPQNIKGFCATGLTCKKKESEVPADMNFGICVIDNTTKDKCAPACSLEFCGSGQGKFKVCSAKGLMYSPPESSRNDCQHVSCRTCFFVPNVPKSCECYPKSPDFKRCRKNCYQLWRLHVQSSIVTLSSDGLSKKYNATNGFTFCKEV